MQASSVPGVVTGLFPAPRLTRQELTSKSWANGPSVSWCVFDNPDDECAIRRRLPRRPENHRARTRCLRVPAPSSDAHQIEGTSFGAAADARRRASRIMAGATWNPFGICATGRAGSSMGGPPCGCADAAGAGSPSRRAHVGDLLGEDAIRRAHGGAARSRMPCNVLAVPTRPTLRSHRGGTASLFAAFSLLARFTPITALRPRSGSRRVLRRSSAP
jgi:hypothetical protein